MIVYFFFLFYCNTTLCFICVEDKCASRVYITASCNPSAQSTTRASHRGMSETYIAKLVCRRSVRAAATPWVSRGGLLNGSIIARARRLFGKASFRSSIIKNKRARPPRGPEETRVERPTNGIDRAAVSNSAGTTPALTDTRIKVDAICMELTTRRWQRYRQDDIIAPRPLEKN